ncbi:MAG TPA: hypothetical protein VN920_11235 [Pyrinomonadaceae bacterium]|nr:hypothetical protein [Pyrinomonadaceae bacterium]
MGALTPGQWYLLFICQKCKIKQVLSMDLSEGRETIAAVYDMLCRECGHESTYDGETMERYQHFECPWYSTTNMTQY